MNGGSLFTGIGGLDLGAERAGLRVAWQAERDEQRRAVLAHHWPHIPCYTDVSIVRVGRVAAVDVVFGGFPCQPASQAGKRLGRADERWLWPEFARVVRELRPRYVVVENVPGLLARGFGDVLGDLAAVGYDAEWTCFGAGDLGAWHQRDRVFLVASADADAIEIWDEQGGSSGRVGPVRHSLDALVSKRLWPTPTLRGNNNVHASPTAQDGVATVLRLSLWPTALSSDGRLVGMSFVAYERRRSNSRTGPRLSEEIGGPLNPEWLEWFMGFPAGWSDARRSATPSSPPAPNSSSPGSSSWTATDATGRGRRVRRRGGP